MMAAHSCCLRGAIALGDALGRIHVFDADEFLCAESHAGG